MADEKKDPLIGEIVGGSYKIEARLGAGGMGTVYLASHMRVERQFAIKVLNFKLSDDKTAVQRFEREAMLGSRLGHEHITQVMDFNHTDEGFPFIVMELLEGEDLSERLKKVGAMSLVETASIMRQVGIALVAAHEEGVVHRDLKPENIFLCERRGGGEAVKVMDFGVSKVLSSDSVVTAHATLLGTPWYMAPEQAEGKVDQMDHRTDLFSLGLILYHMLSGKMPFEGDSVPAILFQVVYSTPDPIGEVMPDLPLPVQEIVTKAISKDKEDRFQSAEEFVKALEVALGETWKEVLIHEVGTEVTGRHRKVRVTGPTAAVDGGDCGTQDTMCAPDGAGDEVGKDVASAATVMRAAEGDEDVASAATVTGQDAALPHLTTLSASAAETSTGHKPGGRRGLVIAGAAVLACAAAGLLSFQAGQDGSSAKPAADPTSLATTRPAPAAPGALPREDSQPPKAGPPPTARPTPPVPPAKETPRPGPVATRPLSISTVPPGARVEVDGKKLGKTPLEGAPVSPEVLRVVLRRAGYGTRTVKVPAGALPHKLRITLVALKASINVVALHNGRPIVADVYLDGKKEDQTPALIPELQAGQYKVQVRSAGYQTRSQNVRLRPGENKRIVISLKKK